MDIDKMYAREEEMLKSVIVYLTPRESIFLEPWALVTGVPELGLSALEPLVIPEIYMEQGTKSLNFKTTLKDVVVHGLTKYEVEDIRFDIHTLQLTMDFVIPGVNIDGTYSITGQIIVTPIEGKGKIIASSGSVKGHIFQQYEETTLADGKIHLKPILTNGTLDIREPHGKLDGLFNGNERLKSIITQIISENRAELFKETKPVLEKTLFKLAEDLFYETIFKRVALDDLYPISDLYPK